jgi:hypothetical protein
MRLTIFGASGGTGRRVVEQALAAGHQPAAGRASQPLTGHVCPPCSRGRWHHRSKLAVARKTLVANILA